MEIAVNYLAVVAAAVASMAIGALWYSPVLFGKQWMRLIGMSNEELEKAKAKGMGKSYAIMFLGSLIMAYVLAHFVQMAGATDLMGAAELGFWVWLGFVATVQLGTVLWENKPWTLYTLNTGYYLVSLIVMSGILVWWK